MSDDDLWADDPELDAEIDAELEEERQAAAEVLHELFAETGEPEPPQPDLDRAAAELVHGISRGGWPYRRLAAVTGWRDAAPDEHLSAEQRWLYAATCSFDPFEEPDGDAELDAATAVLTRYDQALVVAGIVAAGPGADAGADTFARLLREDGVLSEGDETVVLMAAEVLLTDWLALRAVDKDRRLTELGAWGLPTALHDLTCDDSDPKDVVAQLLEGARLDWEVRDGQWTAELYQDVGRLLADVADAPLRLDLREQPAWLPFLESVHEQAQSAEAAYLLAVAAELDGDVARQSSWLDRALDTDPAHEPSLLSAAELASCRGDATRAVELLRRADVPADDEEVRQLLTFTRPPATGPSRNSPCSCGSGRKYKLCCGGLGSAHPLADRSGWLWTKVASFGRSFGFREQVIRRALEATRYQDDPEATMRGLQDPLVHDAVLFEDGALQRFLDERGTLLPTDERSLAQTWLTTRLGVYEVTSTRPGSSVQLRDTDGNVTEVRERTASRTLRRGDLLVTRLLPTGDGMMLGPLLGLPRRARERAASASTAQDLYDLMAELRRPPSVTNTEGHQLVLLTQQWRVSDAGWAQLCEQLGPSEDDEHRWLVRASGHIAASFRRTAEGLSVEVNSRERATEVAELVRRLDPTAQLLSEEEATDSPISSAPEPPTAEMQAALREHLENYEREWCDMQIPALDGRTPREAVRTPEGRAAVEDLLADMPESPNGMSARRLRVLLELPTPLR